MPSRSTLFTGRSARHHGVLYNGYELSPEMPTFARGLQQGGVQTLGVGKYHLECHGRSACNDVRKYGFDQAETTEDIRARDWLDWVRKIWPQHYDQALATVWSMPHLSSYRPERRDLLTEVAEARRRHPPRTVTRLTYPSLVPEEACQTRWVMDRGLALLEERDRQRPFFLYLSFVDPHDPYDPPARFLERIASERIPTPVRPAAGATASALARFAAVPFVKSFSTSSLVNWQLLRRHYLASLAFIDLGRPDAALIETWGSYGDTTVPLRARTVRTRAAALTLCGDGSGMLFDLANDPDETTNLYNQPAAASRIAELKDLLLELLARQDEPLPARHRHPSAAH